MSPHRHTVRTSRDGGFTLIELLVVIIIIGILAAIAIPVFLNQRKKGYNAGIKSDLASIATAFESAYTDSQAYPAGNVLTGAQISPGNIIYAGPLPTTGNGSDGYCIRGSNPKSDASGGASPGTFYWWDSLKGGLQATASTAAPTGGACATAALTLVGEL